MKNPGNMSAIYSNLENSIINSAVKYKPNTVKSAICGHYFEREHNETYVKSYKATL